MKELYLEDLLMDEKSIMVLGNAITVKVFVDGGLTIPEIAESLCISEKDVKTYITAIELIRKNNLNEERVCQK